MPAKSPHGYKYNNQIKRHEVDPLISKVARKAFERFAQGSNQTEISKFLSKYGVTKKSGKPLGLNEVYRLLTNTFYVDKFKVNKELYEASHDLFISKELFDNVQKELEERKRTKFTRQKFKIRVRVGRTHKRIHKRGRRSDQNSARKKMP